MVKEATLRFMRKHYSEEDLRNWDLDPERGQTITIIHERRWYAAYRNALCSAHLRGNKLHKGIVDQWARLVFWCKYR